MISLCIIKQKGDKYMIDVYFFQQEIYNHDLHHRDTQATHHPPELVSV
jgi:hypothetical protein